MDIFTFVLISDLLILKFSSVLILIDFNQFSVRIFIILSKHG